GGGGRPIHDAASEGRPVGRPVGRPDTANAFRMLCRHNKYVQEFARVRDPDEIARREKVWDEVLRAIEVRSGREAATIPAREFGARLRGERGGALFGAEGFSSD